MLKKVEQSMNRTQQNARRYIEFLGTIGLEIGRTLRNPRKFRIRETIYYLDLCGRRSLPIVLIICLLMGIILGFNGATMVARYAMGAEIFIADAVGFVILKELGPLMVAMIATGRAGSSFAAEIGTMKVDEEISAMATMGISPVRFLVLPKLAAMLIALPLLTIFGDVAGILGGMLVCVAQPHLTVNAYWTRTIEVLNNSTFIIGLGKSLIFAVLITLCGCYRGFESEPDAQGVGRSATGAVVDSIFAVVVATALVTVILTIYGY